MIRRRDISPIWQDVKRGTPTANNKGDYVMNDGEEAPPYYGFITQLDGNFILNLNDAFLRRLDRNT